MIQASRPLREKKKPREFFLALCFILVRLEIRDVTIRRSHSDRWPDLT